MTRVMIATFVTLACLLPTVAQAATASSAFRVGITIEHDCRVSRTPDGGTDVSLDCDADAAERTAVRTIAAGAAWPRASEPRADAPRRLQAVDTGDATRMIVVEY